MAILGVGITVCDKIFTLDKLEIGKKQFADSYEQQPGGNAANTLVGLSRLGTYTKILTRVGIADEAGFILQSLRRERVSIRHLEKLEGATTVSHVYVHGGDRTIITYPKFDVDKPIPFDNQTFDGVSIAYIEGVCGAADIEISKECEKRDILLVLGAENNDTNIADLFPYAEAVISSPEFHEQYFGSKDYKNNLDNILKQGPEIAIVTLGEEGALAKTKKGDLLEIPIVPTKTEEAETTGAGDAFAAGFIYGLENGCSYKKSLDFAAFIASRCCEQVGAQKGLPYEADILDRIEELLS